MGNFAVLAIAARTLPAGGVGHVAIMMTALSAAVGMQRALLLEPHLVGKSDASDAIIRQAARWFAISTVLCFFIVLSLSPAPVLANIAVALLTGGATLLDSERYLAFASQRPYLALRLDLVWTAGTIGGLALLGGRFGSTGFVLVWLAPCVVSVLPRESRKSGATKAELAALLKTTRGLGSQLLTDYALGVGSSALSVVALAAVLGSQGVGAIQLTMSWFGPAGIAYSAATPLLLRELRSMSVKRQRQALTALTAGLLLVSSGTVVAATVWRAPTEFVFGSRAGAVVAHAALPIGLMYVAYALATRPLMKMRAVAYGRGVLIARVWSALSILLFPLCGATIGGLRGSTWGFALSGATLTVAATIACAKQERLSRVEVLVQ